MYLTDLTIMPGDKVLAFDSRTYVNDQITPLSVTMKPAVVLRRYGKKGYSDLVDVRFENYESNGHFTYTVEKQ